MLKFHPYSILTGDTRVEFVKYCVLRDVVGFFNYIITPYNDYSYFLDPNARSPWTGVSQFLPTTHKILQFSNGRNAKPTDFLWYSIERFCEQCNSFWIWPFLFCQSFSNYLSKIVHVLVTFLYKVHIFWEGHKILWNMNFTIRQILPIT